MLIRELNHIAHPHHHRIVRSPPSRYGTREAAAASTRTTPLVSSHSLPFLTMLTASAALTLPHSLLLLFGQDGPGFRLRTTPSHIFPSHFGQLLPRSSRTTAWCSAVESPSHSSRKEDAPFIRRLFCVSLISMELVLTAPSIASSGNSKIKGKKSPFDEQRILEQNKRMQTLNNAPADFPGFIREGYNVKVVTNDKYVKCDSGLIYLEIQEGQGAFPKDGQQIVFHYIGYNESGRRVDSTYQQGQPAKTRLGIKAMIPGFEEGIRSMKTGGRRRLIIPPDLGPPVGPSTFFSAKQFEVFDVELLDAKDCTRRTIGFYSDFVCD